MPVARIFHAFAMNTNASCFESIAGDFSGHDFADDIKNNVTQSKLAEYTYKKFQGTTLKKK